MKNLRLQLNRLSVVQISVILLILGLFLGVLFANVFRDSYAAQMNEYQSVVFKDITKQKIDYNGLFLYVIGNNFREFAIFWLLSITILGIPYMVFKIIAFGFSTGFFISAIAMQYGLKGIILILVYEFPHGLIYIPIWVYSLYKGYQLCRTIYYDKRNYLGTIAKQLRSYLLLLLVLAILLMIGSFLEAYIGSFFLKKVLGIFT